MSFKKNLAVISLALLSFIAGCSKTYAGCGPYTLAYALEVVDSVKTKNQLVDRIGPPHATAVFEPENPGNKYMKFWRDKDQFIDSLVFEPENIKERLEYGAPILVYGISHPSSLSGGSLMVFYDQSNKKIIGAAYDKLFKDHGLLDKGCLDKQSSPTFKY